ncbi:isoprenyl transferase [Limoniibacter endophyticus]|uniref:Isoprenyl transferase n=1 Tax=Limoniibacter endophyticus TaxID=1565040 RepID=A0A8J3DM06_9HYPH|nr:isoprenyl transferase [Limoniibacter endophyticus]GHC62092.1 isoprenyl transferase [Limoniibacter endophyticus]
MKPDHLAIIMDGNGRWAKARGLPRLAGHKAGVEALRRAVRLVGEREIKWLTVYAFSSENWTRPAAEITGLMGLLRHFVRSDLAELHGSGVRIHFIGSREGIEPDILKLLQDAENLTAQNTRMNLVIAFNYGARDEILRAAKALARAVSDGECGVDDIDGCAFEKHLDTTGIPDPDLIIRTSGEQRLSNFLMWQAAYSEFVFLDSHWPDFDASVLDDALAQFAKRERRFGGTTAVNLVSS